MPKVQAMAITVGVGLVQVLLPSTASAAPQHSVESFGFSIDAHPYYSEVCGFPVAFELDGTWNTITFTDADGDITRQIRNFRFRAQFSHEERTVTGWARGPEITTFDSDGGSTTYQMGVVGRRVKGGNVMQFTGRTIFHIAADGSESVTFDAGQREDAALLCDALR